ncbi:MAG TPA: motility protein A [Chloroflexota bacterium]|nr:motility protein A [Chloroflexota bacterium]
MAANPPAGPKKSFDAFGIGGVLFGLIAIGVAFIIEGGDLSSLVLPSPFIIVFGGTFAALLAAFPFPTVMKLGKVFQKALFAEKEDPLEAVQTFVRLADKARREGLLSLEDEAAALHDEFMKDGIQEVVDGTPPEQISELLEIRIAEMEARHKECFTMFLAAGGFGPTMGIIGTVLGLVVVLAGLATAGTDQLGHSIATAFIATLYGILSANIFWLPMGERLKGRSAEEVAHKRMIVEGILAIQAGDAPRLVRSKLEGFLSPADRKRSAQAAERAAGGVAEPAAAGAR